MVQDKIYWFYYVENIHTQQRYRPNNMMAYNEAERANWLTISKIVPMNYHKTHNSRKIM